MRKNLTETGLFLRGIHPDSRCESERCMLNWTLSTKGVRMKRKQGARPPDEGKAGEPLPASVHLATLIASVPGIAEQSLRATLESLPSVRVIGTAAGCLSALRMAQKQQVDLVVIDSNLPLEDVHVFLRQLKLEGLETRSIVLAATTAQVRAALAAGADAALRRDASIRQLGAVVAGFQPAPPLAS
jgi:CheY-like chemotaxis protein